MCAPLNYSSVKACNSAHTEKISCSTLFRLRGDLMCSALWKSLLWNCLSVTEAALPLELLMIPFEWCYICWYLSDSIAFSTAALGFHLQTKRSRWCKTSHLLAPAGEADLSQFAELNEILWTDQNLVCKPEQTRMWVYGVHWVMSCLVFVLKIMFRSERKSWSDHSTIWHIAWGD